MTQYSVLLKLQKLFTLYGKNFLFIYSSKDILSLLDSFFSQINLTKDDFALIRLNKLTRKYLPHLGTNGGNYYYYFFFNTFKASYVSFLRNQSICVIKYICLDNIIYNFDIFNSFIFSYNKKDLIFFIITKFYLNVNFFLMTILFKN